MGYINYENLRSFCYSNDKIIKGEIKAIALDFYGLGGQAMHHNETHLGEKYAKYGIVLIHPYSNPWGWMNKEEVALTDEIIDVLFEKYNLSESTKIISTGGSMGGQCALVYCAYAKRTPCLCVTNCPVCDLPFHFTERVDLPRTLYSAMSNEGMPLDKALESRSPYHLIGSKMPKIPYRVFHCDKDGAVNIDAHSRKLVQKMEENGYEVSLRVVTGRGHCDFDLEAKEEYEQIVIDEAQRG
jgi:dipeptidyl aminopeptidase/acylaminoacyl peptidase